MVIDPREVTVGDRIRFDGRSTSWLVRGQTADGRYQVATCYLFGVLQYTVIDREEGIRGPLNVIGQGMDAETDEGIAEIVGLLEGHWLDHPEGCTCGAYACAAAASGTYEVSHRNRVPLRVTSRRAT